MAKSIEFQFPPAEYQLGGLFFNSPFKYLDVKKLIQAYSESKHSPVIIKLKDKPEKYFAYLKKDCTSPSSIDDFAIHTYNLLEIE